MLYRRLFAILGLMATLCFGLVWAGGVVQGAPPPRPQKDALALAITPTYAPAVTPTAIPTSSGPTPVEPPPNMPIDYPNFSDVSNLSLVGAAEVRNNEIQLQGASTNSIRFSDYMVWVAFTVGQSFAQLDVDILSWLFNR
jgi:hypothetical protein